VTFPRLSALFRRSRMESDLAEELRFHVESRTDDLMRSGYTPEDAARRARLEFGAMEAYKETCREVKGILWFDELRNDIRYTLRTLRTSPGFALASVLSLAVGIGVNLSCFVSVNAIVLHPFPYPRLDRIMTLWEINPRLGTLRYGVAPANFFDWKQNTGSFETLSAYRTWDVTQTGVQDPQRVQGALVTTGFFELLGVQPLRGRSFSDRESEPGYEAVAVVSHAFWKNRLGSTDPIGKAVVLGGRNYTVIGVMPEDFDFPLGTELWAPWALSPEARNQRGIGTMAVLGRLKPGVSFQQGRSEFLSISGMLAQRYPQTNEGRSVLITPLLELTNQITDRFALILLCAAIFVLLLACANVGNLQLARSTARQKEFGLRAALGAGRFRIARQLLTENIVIAILGGVVGLFLAYWNLSVTKAGIPPQVLRWVAGLRTMRMEPGVIAAGFGLSVAAGIVCGLPSIYQLLRTRSRVNESLKEGGRNSLLGSSHSLMRNALVVAEVAIALVLVIAAGLMVRTFERILALDAGFDPKNVLTMQIALTPANYRDNSQAADFYHRVLQRLDTLSGVEASATQSLWSRPGNFAIEGRTELLPGEPRPDVRAISARYFQVMRIPILQGRPISESDGAEAPRVVVVSESFARHYWPDSVAVGQAIKFGTVGTGRASWLVSGVCGDVKDWFGGAARPAAYVSYQQLPSLSMQLLLRTSLDPMKSVNGARAEVRSVDANQPLYDVKSMEQILSEETSGVRMAAGIMSGYAAIAVLLAVIGSYAVASFFVVQRTQEIGIRMALGATRQNILRLILSHTARTSSAGLAIGLVLALVLTQIMSHVLYNLVAIEPMMFVALTSLLAVSALLAGYIPARRAAHSDPMAALRNE
jgi:predicted permease